MLTDGGHKAEKQEREGKEKGELGFGARKMVEVGCAEGKKRKEERKRKQPERKEFRPKGKSGVNLISEF